MPAVDKLVAGQGRNRIPTRTALQMKQPPELSQLETMSDLGIGMVIEEGEELKIFKSDCIPEFDQCVTSGEIDVLSEMQPLIVPPRNESMIGY